MSASSPQRDHQAVRKARTRLIVSQPWFAALALHLQLREDPNLPTAATDGRFLYYNPTWYAKLDPRYAEGVLAHEVMHCALHHMTRREGRDHGLWNMAGDHAINLQLKKAGFLLPDGCLADPRFEGMSSEQIYAILKREGKNGSGYIDPLGGVQDAQAPQQPQPGSGTPAPSIANAPTNADLDREWDLNVASATAISKKAGRMPGNIEQTVAPGQRGTNWQDILQRYLVFPGDVQFTRPNRRMLAHGYIFPGAVPERPGRVDFYVDCSGSVPPELLALFGGECEQILKSAGWPAEVHVIYWSHEVTGHDDLSGQQQLTFNPRGGGGTLFQPALDWTECNIPGRPDVAFVLTDLELGDVPQDPGFPVVWIAPLGSYKTEGPFGETVLVPV